LIEELRLAVVPVPQLLPEMKELAAQGQPASAAPSLLVLGNVDFGAPPKAGTDAGRAFRFVPLPGTTHELESIQRTFRQHFPDGTVRAMSGGEAAKVHLQKEAPGKRYLHLATHGFFAPAGLKSALDSFQIQARGRPGRSSESRSEDDTFLGVHPGLLSGLALAGANRPGEQAGEHGGILTAQEVAELPLSAAELVVLSACESGLGQEAGGEGLLGLQRAFQTSGARAVVASLWQVDDAATQELMSNFYVEHWEHGKGRLEALRAAQLKLLRGQGGASGLRGVGAPEFPVDPSVTQSGRPPRFWAAWVLSGEPGELLLDQPEASEPEADALPATVSRWGVIGMALGTALVVALGALGVYFWRRAARTARKAV
jgi:CHAT domain-containing protein